MRNFELRIATQRVVLSVKWLQTRSRSRTHSSANPRANNTPNPRNILVDVTVRPKPVNNKQHSNHRKSARADRTSGARSTLGALTKRSSHARTTWRGRTTLPETSPSSQRPHSGAPKQPTPHDTPARTVTNTHSDSTGGVAPRIPTPAGPLRARNLDKRLCVESSAAARRLVPLPSPSSAAPKGGSEERLRGHAGAYRLRRGQVIVVEKCNDGGRLVDRPLVDGRNRLRVAKGMHVHRGCVRATE